MVVARTLVMLALASLLVAPLAPPAAAMSAAMSAAEAAGMSEDMPCCPPDDQSVPDCQKGCPLATLCAFKGLSAAPLATHPARAVPLLITQRALRNDPAPDWADDPPIPPPPRS